MEKRNDTLCCADWLLLLLLLLLRQKQWSIDYSLLMTTGFKGYQTGWSKIVKKTTEFRWKRETMRSDAHTDSSSFSGKSSGARVIHRGNCTLPMQWFSLAVPCHANDFVQKQAGLIQHCLLYIDTGCFETMYCKTGNMLQNIGIKFLHIWVLFGCVQRKPGICLA